MATYPKKIKPARIWPNNALQGLRVSLNQTAPEPTSGVRAATQGVAIHMGTIPAGSVVFPLEAYVKTAFTASVTIDIGTEADPDAFGTSAGVAPQATGWKRPLTGAGLGLVTVDTPVFLLVDGAAPAAGVGDFVLPFYTAKD